jgi:hypothetical protein
MKVGVCEGSPRSIIPDHLGRADYHGSSINQAARYMDAGAHGGQVGACWALVHECRCGSIIMGPSIWVGRVGMSRWYIVRLIRDGINMGPSILFLGEIVGPTWPSRHWSAARAGQVRPARWPR